MMRIVFMGNAAFGCPTLHALAHDPKITIVSVYTHPPKPMGRGHKVNVGPIQALAERLSLPVVTPLSLRSAFEVERLQALAPDMVVVAAYGLMLPPQILEIPPHGCINIHASLLPRWRGASPIQQAILAGDAQSGLSIMHMEAGLDTGPTYALFPVFLKAGETSQTLHDTLAHLAAEILPSLVHQIPDLGAPTPQEDGGVLYAHKITRESTCLVWDRPAHALERCVRAFYPAPKAWTTWQGQNLKIGQARVDPSCTDAPPGTIIDHPFKIACGEGSVLQILELQKADSRMMHAAAFLCGQAIPIGARLGTS